MSYLIYVVSWLLAVSIHINTLKRTALTNTKDAINSEIYSLLKANEENKDLLVKETVFSHKFARIEKKIKEFNNICKGDVASTKHESFTDLFTFNLDEGCQRLLTEKCYDAVEYVDDIFHKNIQNKYSFFYLNRYEIAGTISTLLGTYLIIKIVNWLYSGTI